MGATVVLGGVPTEDVELGYILSGGFHSHGQEWQASADGVAWAAVGSGPTFTPGDAEAGKHLRVVVRAADDQTDAEFDAASGPGTVVNIDDEPQGTLAILGEAVEGATLTLAEAVTDADGMSDPGRGYEWQAQGQNGDWTTVPGGRGPSFTLTQAEVGRAVRAVVSYVDDHGNREWVVTAPTAPVANVNDAPRGGLAITGTAKQGEILSLADTVTDADGWLGIPAAAGLFAGADPTGSGYFNDPDPAELGVRFTASSAGSVTGLRFYKAPGDAGAHVGHLWTAAGELLATAAFAGETASGWQRVDLAAPVGLAAGATYVASYSRDAGTTYVGTWGFFDTAHGSGPLTAPAGGNGVFVYAPGAFPTETYRNSNYWVDVVFDPRPRGSEVGAGGFGGAHLGYQWQAQDGGGAWIDIAGATGGSFAPTQAEVGRAVRAVFRYTDGQGTREAVLSAPTLAVENANDAPDGALAVVGAARQGATLALADAVTDAGGIPGGGRSYRWQAQGGDGGWADIPGATGAAFAPTQAEVGRAVRGVLSYTDGQGTEETVFGAATAAVENANDAPFGTLAVVGAARRGETLSLVDLVNDEDGIPDNGRSYKWQVQDGSGGWADIPGATADTFTLTRAEVGRAVRGVLVYTDAGGAAEAFAGAATAAVGNANAPLVGAPVLHAGPGGQAPVEDVAVAVDTSGVADPDGPGAFAYAWSREVAGGAWTAIAGADGAGYTPGDADVGARLRVEVRYTDGAGTREGFELVTASAVANANDAPTGAVALSGQAVRGGTVIASTDALADADGMGPVSLRWERADGNGGWAPIAGATEAAYTFGRADVGRALRAVAAWTDGHGTAEEAVAETGVVARRAIALPPPGPGETERDAAADEWTSADLAAMVADGGSFAPPAGVEYVRLADGILSFGTGTAEAFVARLYLGLLGRGGDAEGLAFWCDALENGASRVDLARLFLGGGEFGARHWEQTKDGFVADLYAAFLGRAGDAAERGFWTAALDGGASRAEVAAGIAGGAEAADLMEASTAGVFVADWEAVQARGLYRCALGREAEAAGLRFWSGLLERGAGPDVIGGAFEGSAEFRARHGAASDGAFVEGLYRDGLGRAADPAGLAFWAGLLDAGAVGRGELALRFAATEEARSHLDWGL